MIIKQYFGTLEDVEKRKVKFNKFLENLMNNELLVVVV